jgi:hypothetical protein
MAQSVKWIYYRMDNEQVDYRMDNKQIDCRMNNKQIVVWFSAGMRDLSLLLSIQAGPEAHPTSYSVGTRGSYAKCKAANMWS